MRLVNKDCFILQIASLQASHLQNRVCVQRVVRARWNACQQGQVFSEEGITTSRKRCETNFIAAFDWLPVEEHSIWRFEHPLALLIESLILGL